MADLLHAEPAKCEAHAWTGLCACAICDDDECVRIMLKNRPTLPGWYEDAAREREAGGA